MRLFYTLKYICLTITLACTSSFANTQGVTDKEIILGSSLSLNAGKNDYGTAALQGMSLYFDAVNAAGGVNGRKIVHRVLDDEEKAAKAEANARKLLKDGAFILFSSIDGGPSTAVGKVANEAKVVHFGPMAGPSTLRKPHQPYVFPVRAEHKDEFRALMAWGKNTGLKTVGFLHADSEGGRVHLENVRIIAKELGLDVILTLPFKSDTTAAQINDMAKSIVAKEPDMMINHGSAGLYQKLIVKAKTGGARAAFMGVNSGSSQIAKGLGKQAAGMVFAQVVPNPAARKTEIAREYQDAVRKANAQVEFSYGGLEGFLTAKAMVIALRKTGKQLTQKNLIDTLVNAEFDLGGFLMRFKPGNHAGSQFVDLSIVSQGGKFVQ